MSKKTDMAHLMLLLAHLQPQEAGKCNCAVSAVVISHSYCITELNDRTTRV